MSTSQQDANGPLLLCAFDHRDYFERLVAQHSTHPLSPFAGVALAKELVLEAALAAGGLVEPEARTGLGVFVDEQYGAHVARRARAEGLLLAMPAERSSAPEFQCEFGERFAAHITTFDPHLVKVLVRHNPEDDADLLARQAARLRELSDWCRSQRRALLFELLVPALPAQDAPDYVATRRLGLTLLALEQLVAAGIRPAVWKLEAPADVDDFSRLFEACRAEDPEVRVVVLGGGADSASTVRGVRAAAAAGYDGFAVGRTIWAEPLTGWLRGSSTREQAVEQMAATYAACISAYHAGVAARPAAVPA